MSHVIDRIIKLCREKGYNYGTVDDDKVVILARRWESYDEVMRIVNGGNEKVEVSEWRNKDGSVAMTACITR